MQTTLIDKPLIGLPPLGKKESQMRLLRPLVKSLTWSEEQQKILDAAENSTENLCIEAAAGSGKTTLITAITTILPASSLLTSIS